MTKKTIQLLFLVSTAYVCISAFLYFQYGRAGVVAKTNCLRFHSGTATVEVTYTDVLFSNSFDYGIRLYKKEDANKIGTTEDAMPVISVDDSGGLSYDSVDSIVKGSELISQGPRFDKKTTLSGLEAALATPSLDHFYYEVPLGNRVLNVDYIPDQLTPIERKQTDDMLSKIVFKQVPDDVKPSSLDHCE